MLIADKASMPDGLLDDSVAKRIIGIDPGNRGAAVELVCLGDKRTPQRYSFFNWIERKNRLPDLDISTIFKWMAEGGVPDCVVLESQQFFGKNEKSTMGAIRVISAYREILGALKVLRWNYVVVPPAVWQKKLVGSLPLIPGEKYAARRKRNKKTIADWVVANYPEFNLKPGRHITPHDGIADALAIAHWGHACKLPTIRKVRNKKVGNGNS